MFLVSCESYYGDHDNGMRLFATKKEAEDYEIVWIGKTDGNFDIIVKEIELSTRSIESGRSRKGSCSFGSNFRRFQFINVRLYSILSSLDYT